MKHSSVVLLNVLHIIVGTDDATLLVLAPRSFEEPDPEVASLREWPYLRTPEAWYDRHGRKIAPPAALEEYVRREIPGLRPHSLHQPIRPPHWGSSGFAEANLARAASFFDIMDWSYAFRRRR